MLHPSPTAIVYVIFGPIRQNYFSSKIIYITVLSANNGLVLKGVKNMHSLTAMMTVRPRALLLCLMLKVEVYVLLIQVARAISVQ